jgi:hypothetical protein
MKKAMLWIWVMAMAVSPLLAQEEGEPTVDEQQIEEEIEKALAGNEGTEESVTLVDEDWEDSSATDDPQRREIQTLMTGSGGYGAISFGYTQINDLHGLEMGAQAAWVIGHNFGLGIRGTGFTSDLTPVGPYNYAVSGGYGGLLMEPIIMGWWPVHFAFPIMVGGGGVASYAMYADPWDYGYSDPYFTEAAGFFVTEVGIELEVNLVRFFRLSIYGNYRWTTDLDMKPSYGLDPAPPGERYYVDPKALHGFSAGVRFKFGSF